MASPGGLHQLIDAHYEALYRYAYRLSGTAADAEDLTQETFGKAVSRLPQLREPGRAEDETTPEIDPARLQKALDELDEGFRTPIILFYFEEFSYRDIAEQMDLPIGTVMSRLARAKAYLRAKLAPP